MPQIPTPSFEPARRWSTIALLEKLEKSGVKRETATVLVEVLEEAHEHQNATKADLKETEHRLQLEIEKVRREIKEIEGRLELKIAETNQKIAETNQKIAETKADLVRWMVGAMIAQTGIIVGILGFLIKFS